MKARFGIFVTHMRVAGIDAAGGGPEALDAALKAETVRVTAAAQRANLRAE